MERLFRSAPQSFAAVVQDPPERAEDFNAAYGTTFSPVPDTEPYDLSNAFGVRTVPTVFVIDEGGRVEDVAESWDREGWNRATRRLAELTGLDIPPVSEEGDGLPPFRPG
jgi:peroxiredoxin